MQIQNKWATPIGKFHFPSFSGLKIEVLCEEAMQLPQTMLSTQIGEVKITREILPICSQVIDEFLKPKVDEFIQEYGGRAPRDLKWHGWVHACLNGQGLSPHLHMGDSFVSSVLYLTDSKANMVLRDPRAPTIRCLPTDMIRHQHGEEFVKPVAGEFVMFPSYVDHYVISTEPDFRVALGVDWCFS